MKTLHIVSLVCFALAVVFYVTPWSQGAVGLMAIGFVFEAIAWMAIIKAQRSGSSGQTGPTPAVQTTDQPTTQEASHPGSQAT